nr:hypothetical protein [Tanacetum cinerariifolium]
MIHQPYQFIPWSHVLVSGTRPNPRYAGHVSTISPLPWSYKEAFNEPNWRNAMFDDHKFLADGTLSRYKAHLVANGSTHVKGVDVDETFSLLDVRNAFLHGDLANTVYMHQPLGTSRLGDDTAFLLLYVDDTVLTASSDHLLQQIIASLHREFSMTDLGALNYFLGDGGTPVVNPTLYRSLAGVSFLCSQADFGYVQGISDYGLQLFSSTTDSFIAYSDADWAGCLTMRRSTSGVANAVIKTCWIQNLLHELHTPLSSATIVYCDNAFEDDVALPVELAKARSRGRSAMRSRLRTWFAGFQPTPSLISSKPARELEGSNGSKMRKANLHPTPSLKSSQPAWELEGSNGSKMAGKYKRSVLDDPGSGGSMRRTRWKANLL